MISKFDIDLGCKGMDVWQAVKYYILKSPDRWNSYGPDTKFTLLQAISTIFYLQVAPLPLM
jgi:hypothetical protein